MGPNKPPVAHYDRGSVQPIDFMEGNFTADEYLGFLKGQVIKYISRFRYKGTPIADLEKAQTYLGWLREYYGRLSADFDMKIQPSVFGEPKKPEPPEPTIPTKCLSCKYYYEPPPHETGSDVISRCRAPLDVCLWE
jgi:hypothetical protein